MQLGWQRVAFRLLIKARQKRVVAGVFEQDFRAELFGQLVGQAGFARADRAFDDDLFKAG